MNRGYLNTFFSHFLNENYKTSNFDYKEHIPKDIKKILDEYDLFMDFDWNEKQDKYGDGFKKWFSEYRNKKFKERIDDILAKVEEDIENVKKRKEVKDKFIKFENLLKDTLDPKVLSKILSKPLNKYQEFILLNRHTPESISKGLKDGENIFDKDGNIDKLKTTDSDIFKGNDISIYSFENFVENNPEYKKLYNDFKKLFDDYINTSLIDLNAYRNSTPLSDMVTLRDFLIKIKN